MVRYPSTISACTSPGMPATWPSIRLCWLSTALLAFSAALLAFSAAAFRGPPSPSFRQRRRVDADGFATSVTAGSPGTGVAVTAKPTAAPDLAQADLCKPGWHFNLHSGDGTFRRARMTGKKRRCDSVIMHAAHGGMAASYDSPTIYAVKPGRVYTISYELRTDNLAPCCRGDTNRAGALTGGAYLRFFDMHGVKGSFSPALGTHAPQSTGGAWVRRSQRIETPTTARSARLHLAFAAHAPLLPNRMRGGNATGSAAFRMLSVRDDGDATPPLPPTISVPDPTIQKALEVAFACLHNSQLSAGEFAVSAGYTLSRNLAPDLTFGLHGLRRTAHAAYLHTIRRQWDAYLERKVPSILRHGKIYGRVLTQLMWPLGVDQIFSATGDVAYLQQRLPIIDASIAYIKKQSDLGGLATLIPKGRGKIGGGVDWNDWYPTRLDGRTFQFHIWLVRLLERASHLHLEHASSFGSRDLGSSYAASAQELRRTLQRRYWRGGAGGGAKSAPSKASQARALPYPHWCTNIDYADEGEWVDDTIWSLYLDIANTEQRAALWAHLEADAPTYETFPTRWAKLDGQRISFRKGAVGGAHFGCSWFGRLGAGDILARARDGRRVSSHALLQRASGVFASDGNIYEGYSMNGNFKKGCSTKGYGDYTEHCAGLVWAVVEGIFGARLDSDMSDKTVAAIEPQFPPEWRTASMRVPLRGYVLRLSWERPVLELLLLPPPDVAADASSSVPATRANTSWVPSSHLPPSLRMRLSARCARTGTTAQQHASTNSSARVVTLEPGKPIRVVCRDSASVEPPQWVPPHPGDGNQLSKSARLRKMHSPLSLAPRALGCVQHGTGLKGSMCTFSDVCVSPRDGILVPNTSRLDPGLRRLPFDPKSGWLLEGDPFRLSSKIGPLKMRLVSPNVLKAPNVLLYASGSSFMVNCWRQHVARENPSHLMHGYGALFAASAAATASGSLDASTLLFHQCPEVNDADGAWKYGQAVSQLVRAAAASSHLTIAPPDRVNLATLSYRRYSSAGGRMHSLADWMALPRRDDTVICAQRLTVAASSPSDLGDNSPRVQRAWAREYKRLYQQRASTAGRNASIIANVLDELTPATLAAASCDADARPSCRRALRVAMFQRDGSASNGQRKILNVHAVHHAVRRVVGVHTRLLSLHGDTPWEAQLEAFRSFDLLITAHGSHLVNLLYSRRHTAVIEMQPLHIDGTFCKNGPQHIEAYIMSYGHAPAARSNASTTRTHPAPDPELMSEIARCHADPAHRCRRGKIKGRDLIVNITRLEADLRVAERLLCSCDAVERAQAKAAVPKCKGNAPLN